MYTSTILLSFAAIAYARFGEENTVQGIIGAIPSTNGQAATLAGASIGTLLAGANACAKLTLADQVAALGGAAALEAAKALVQAEKNFNPFAVSIPSFCDDASLPATAELRGILPLVDPAVEGAATQNAASEASLADPLNAGGLSVAGLVEGLGAVPFTPQSSGGAVGQEVAAGGATGGGTGAGAGDAAATTTTAAAAAATTAAAAVGNTGSCNPDNTAEDNADDTADDASNTDDTTAATSADLQTFTGAVGAAILPITFSGNTARPFSVNGNTFVNFAAAATRTCDIQFNACANAANSGQNVAFADCNTQKTACAAAQSSATVKSFSARKVRRDRGMRTRREVVRKMIVRKRKEIALLELELV